MSDKLIEIKMYVPERNLVSFRKVASDLFPNEQEKDAVSMLLSMFVEYLGDERQWTLFIPGLPIAVRDKWQAIADEIASRIIGQQGAVAPQLKKYADLIKEQGSLPAEDAVAMIIEMAAGGEVSIGNKKVGDGIARAAQAFSSVGEKRPN